MVVCYHQYEEKCRASYKQGGFMSGLGWTCHAGYMEATFQTVDGHFIRSLVAMMWNILHINWLARLCPSTVAKESKKRMVKHKYVRFQGIQDPTSCACQGAISVWVELSNLACDTGRGWHWSSHGCVLEVDVKPFKLHGYFLLEISSRLKIILWDPFTFLVAF